MRVKQVKLNKKKQLLLFSFFSSERRTMAIMAASINKTTPTAEFVTFDTENICGRRNQRIKLWQLQTLATFLIK